VEINAPEVQESPHAMDMDELIEEPGWSVQRLLETREIVDAMMTQDPEIFEEESVTLHHVTYNRETKKLLLEKVNTKNKKSSERWKYSIDLDGVAPSKIADFHGATGDALRQSIDNMEKENSELKKRIKELEVALVPGPLFPEPLSSIQPTLELEDIPERSTKYKGSSSLLQVVRKYVGDAIQKRIDIIQEIWELSQSIASFSSRIQNFKEYLQKDLENDEGFFKEVVNTFSAKVSSLNEARRKEQKTSLALPYEAD
jgi:hypothetical protein